MGCTAPDQAQKLQELEEVIRFQAEEIERLRTLKVAEKPPVEMLGHEEL